MDTLRDGLLQLCIELLSLDGQIAVVRPDPLPGFQDLAATRLKKHCIVIEIGRILNEHKYPVAKNVIQELQEVNLREDPYAWSHYSFIVSTVSTSNDKTPLNDSNNIKRCNFNPYCYKFLH